MSLRIPRVVKFGSDFSGLDTAAIALKRAGIPTRQVFASDANTACRLLLSAKRQPDNIHEDITQRRPEEEEYCDVYVTTPPCQPYSSQGKRKGMKDKRAKALSSSFQYVKRKRPRLVIFENVKGLTHKKFRPILRGIGVAFQKMGYKLWKKVLCSSDYRVCQIRRRIFIVAIRKDSLRAPFIWPEPLGSKALDSILDPPCPTDRAGRLPPLPRPRKLAIKADKEVHSQGINPLKVPAAVDVGCSESYLCYGVNISRTLCRGRAGSGGFWLSTRGRRMSVNEMMRVSGIRPDELSGWKAAGVSKSQLGQMLGNCVPVPLVGEVLQSGTLAAGLLASKKPFPTEC